MNWYKKSQAMFETFNLEDKVFTSFSNHFNNLIKKYGEKIVQENLNNYKELRIGSYNISSAMEPIIKKYGKPNSIIPKQIDFVIISSKHPEAEKDAEMMLVIDDKNKFILVKILDNIKNFKIDNSFKYHITHELQHLLKKIYGGKENPNLSYYASPNEIQAYSAEIAKMAIELISNDINLRKKKLSAKQYKEMLLNTNRYQLISSVLLIQLNKLFRDMEKSKEKPNEELKRKYYEAAIRNFNKLLDRLIEEKLNH